MAVLPPPSLLPPSPLPARAPSPPPRPPTTGPVLAPLASRNAGLPRTCPPAPVRAALRVRRPECPPPLPLPPHPLFARFGLPSTAVRRHHHIHITCVFVCGRVCSCVFVCVCVKQKDASRHSIPPAAVCFDFRGKWGGIQGYFFVFFFPIFCSGWLLSSSSSLLSSSLSYVCSVRTPPPAPSLFSFAVFFPLSPVL